MTVSNAAVDKLALPSGKTDLTGLTSLVASSFASSFTLSNDTILEVVLPDGTVGLIHLDAAETSNNVSFSDLLDDINFAISESAALSTFYDGNKVIAYDAGGGVLGIELSSTLYPSYGAGSTDAWYIEAFPDYKELTYNGAVLDLGFEDRTTDVALKGTPLTALSGEFGGIDPYTLRDPASLLFSINGSDFVSVNVPAETDPSVEWSIGDLIGELNLALQSTPVVIGSAPFQLSEFIRAALSSNGELISFQSLLTPSVGVPDVMTMRVLADPSAANNSAVTSLGFGIVEQRAGWRGGEVYLDNISLLGTAEVSGETFASTASLGFADFASDSSIISLEAVEGVQFSSGAKTRFSLVDLNEFVSSGNIFDVASEGVGPGSFATLELNDLRFTGDAVDGLSFDHSASISIEHVSSGSGSGVVGYGSRITDFGELPEAYVTFHNTGGLESLSLLSFDDVFQGLIRSGEFISEQMQIDPDGSGAAVNAFGTSLLFVKESLLDAFDFGYQFEETVAQMIDAPPQNLQSLREAIASTLQIDETDVSVKLVTDYSSVGSLESSDLLSASIEIELPFVLTFAKQLDLFVDLAQLRNRSRTPALVKQYLAGLDALTHSPSNPMGVDLNILSKLDLAMGVEIVNDAQRQTPVSVLRDSTVIETDFNLAGDEFYGDLPVGNARLRLSNGRVAVNASGETETYDEHNTERVYNEAALTPGYVQPLSLAVDAVTTENLGGSFDSSAKSITGGNEALIIDGVNLSVGDLVAVNNQEDLSYDPIEQIWDVDESRYQQNGVYQVTQAGGASESWELVRYSGADDAAELNDLYLNVLGGDTYAGRQFLQVVDLVNVGQDAVSFAKLIDPAEFAITLNSDFELPYAVRVATTSQIDAVYSSGLDNPGRLTARANSSFNGLESVLGNGNPISGIDGVNDFEVGDLVLLKDQVSDSLLGSDIRFQNGVYRVVDLGLAGVDGSKWVLERVAFADDPLDFRELRISVQEGRDNERVNFIQTNTNLSSLSAGQIISFTSELSRVYSEASADGQTFTAVADITPNGEARAELPMTIVVTDEDGNEKVISRDTSHLTDADASNPAIVATLPTFSPVNIQIESFNGRSGLDRFFDLNVAANDPNTPAPVVFEGLPNLGANIPTVDVLQMARDPFLMGEALDLSLFNLQLAIDQALGNELPLLGFDLPRYTLFIEDWRADFTRQLRDELRNNKLKPINAILDSLTQALGPGGAGLISGRHDITVETLDSAEVATVWDPTDSDNYDLTPLNEEFEKTPTGAVSLEFSLDLVKEMDSSSTETMIESIHMPEEFGLTIDNQTSALDANQNAVQTTGGVNLRTSFALHLGFGVDLHDGFYLFNPADDGVGDPESVMTVGVEAVLDGDVATQGIQQFVQGEATSQLNELTISAADAMTAPVVSSALSTDDEAGASGFRGNFEFFLNQGTGGNDLQRTTIPDMQIRGTLGVDPALIGTSLLLPKQLGVLSFDTHGDIDLNLYFQGGKQGSTFGENGGIPEIQTEFFFQGRFGSGYSGLSYVSKVTYEAALTAVANGTATQVQEEIAANPEFRIDRDLLLNGAKVEYLNTTLDAEGFLKGTIFEMLLKFAEGMEHIRPAVDFLITPVPGTEWMDEPFVIGDLLGANFVKFLRAYVSSKL
ncbi:MAG: hypothetical protein AAF226_02625 [Verrucomicrobiota bacterium]